MIGKQVNFFMLPEDERTFLDFVLNDPLVILIQGHADKRRIQIIQDPVNSLQQSHPSFEVLIARKDLPIEREHIRTAHLQNYDEEQGIYFETGEVRYWVDKSEAPVIEFHRSRIRGDGELSRGRIWASMYRLQNDTWVRKDKAFEHWYDRLARWLRRNFKYDKHFYFGPAAQQWYQAGKPIRRI